MNEHNVNYSQADLENKEEKVARRNLLFCRLDHIATFLTGAGVGFMILRIFESGMSIGIAWSLMGVGAIAKLILSAKTNQPRLNTAIQNH